MYDRILVPLDGSPTAELGFAEALALAKKLDSTLVLVSIVEWFPMFPEMTTASTWALLGDELRGAARELLDRAHERARDAGIAAETWLLEGAEVLVADTIVQQAAAHRCGLIVMGTHGRRGLRHALLGSDAEAVLRTSPVPVLMVRGGAAAAA